MFEPTCEYEKEHDFTSTPENPGVCRTCGMTDGSTSWGRYHVWSYMGQSPGKCNMPVFNVTAASGRMRIHLSEIDSIIAELRKDLEKEFGVPKDLTYRL